MFIVYALIFIHRRFGSLFWLLRGLIGSLFHKKNGPLLGPYLKAWGSLSVLEAVDSTIQAGSKEYILRLPKKSNAQNTEEILALFYTQSVSVHQSSKGGSQEESKSPPPAFQPFVKMAF